MDLEPDDYHRLFDAHPLPVFVAERDTQCILVANRAACDFYGWSHEEFVTKTLRDLRPPEEIPAFLASYHASKDTTRPYSRSARHRARGGRLVEVTLEISWLTLRGRPASLVVVTDVTGIAQAERRFRLLVEHSADGIVLTTPEHVVAYLSPGGERILGHPAAEIVGASAYDRTHPDDASQWTAPEPGETRQFVGRMRHRDGSWRWIESSTTNLTHDPAVRAYVTNYRDITERKLAERAIIESQQRLEFLLSATSAITYTARLSPDYDATFMSANVKHVLGYEPAMFTGQFWRANIHPEDLAMVDAELAEVADKESLILTYRFLHRDGNYRWMRDVARVLRDAAGTPTEVVGYWIDVTDQVRAESALRRSETNFRTLIERMPTATFVHRDGIYRYVNPAAVAMLGYRSADQIIGRSVAEFIHPDDRELVSKRIAALERTGSIAVGAGRMLRADGSVFVIETEAVQLDFDGELCNVVMGNDVTERHAVFARMALADRMLTVGTLAAGVAHEINNPLAYVGTNLETLAGELPNIQLAPRSRLDAATLGGLVADARDGVQRVSAIVRELRALARRDKEARGPVDVAAVLASSIKMAHNEIRHRARVIVTCDNELPLVEGDGSKLGQVFLNLLINAAHAIPDGRAEHNTIRVAADAMPDRKHVRVAISDTGAGIAANIVRRIFDPFFTTKAPGVGMGLGLSISHQIVASMGGEITVESEPGVGSTFRVTLPAAAAVCAVAGERGCSSSEMSARVLLIDDEAAVGRSVALSLAPETEVIAVTRAADALARLADGERFDAILCDLMMPEISGMELYHQLAHIAPGYTRRIIFMTGGAFTPQAREFLAALDRPHLEKPFSEAQIRRAIESVARQC